MFGWCVGQRSVVEWRPQKTSSISRCRRFTYLTTTFRSDYLLTLRLSQLVSFTVKDWTGMQNEVISTLFLRFQLPKFQNSASVWKLSTSYKFHWLPSAKMWINKMGYKLRWTTFPVSSNFSLPSWQATLLGHLIRSLLLKLLTTISDSGHCENFRGTPVSCTLPAWPTKEAFKLICG